MAQKRKSKAGRKQELFEDLTGLAFGYIGCFTLTILFIVVKAKGGAIV